MPALLEIFLLALAAMFFPALLAVVLIALRTTHPQRLLASFLAGGFLAATSVGIAIVFSLQDASVDSSSSRSFDPIVYFVAGALALLAAYVVDRKELLVKKTKPEDEGAEKKPDRLQRALDHGAPYAFVAGLILCAVPGVSALVALKDIAQLGYSTTATIAVIIVFFVIMFAFIELPLIGYFTAPERATQTTLRFNAWLDRNANRIAVRVLAVLGVLLIARGVGGLF
jgi:Sap, sulfolipid-1-addressing protein